MLVVSRTETLSTGGLLRYSLFVRPVVPWPAMREDRTEMLRTEARLLVDDFTAAARAGSVNVEAYRHGALDLLCELVRHDALRPSEAALLSHVRAV